MAQVTTVVHMIYILINITQYNCYDILCSMIYIKHYLDLELVCRDLSKRLLLLLLLYHTFYGFVHHKNSSNFGNTF